MSRMTGVKFHRSSAHHRSLSLALAAVCGGALAIAGPGWADPLAAGSATVAGTAAMAPQHQSTVVPGSLDRETSPDILTAPALPSAPPPLAARPEAHPPSAAELKLGVPLRCEDPSGFFPHVAACRLAWRAITPIVPAVIEPEAAPRAKATMIAAPAIVAPAPALPTKPETERRREQSASAAPLAAAPPPPAKATPIAAPAIVVPAPALPTKPETERRREQSASAAPLAAAPPPRAKEPATVQPAAPHAAPLKRASVPPEAPVPQPRTVAIALPATTPAAPRPAAPPVEAVEPPHQELAAAASDVPPKLRTPSPGESSWTAPRVAAAGAMLTAQSKQAAKDGGAFAMVEAACNTHDKQFSLRAALVDGAGSAIIPLTERMQIGDTAMQPAYFHTELAFNKLVLTSGYGGAAISEASANVLLAAKQALYEIKTNDGTVLIKIAATDGNLRKVLQACQSRE